MGKSTISTGSFSMSQTVSQYKRVIHSGLLCKRDCLSAHLAGRLTGRRMTFTPISPGDASQIQNEMTRYLRKEARSRGPKITGFNGTIYRKIMENLQGDFVFDGKVNRKVYRKMYFVRKIC